MLTLDDTKNIEACDGTPKHYEDNRYDSVTYIETITTNPLYTNNATTCVNAVEYEHFKEQLALSREEIKALKTELEEEKGRSDRQKDYYEGIIRDYRKMAEEAKENADMLTEIVKVLATLIK